MKAILVSKDHKFTENLKEKLKGENISLRSVSYVSNLNVQLLYSNFDIVIIDSKLTQNEIYEINILLHNYAHIKIMILHRSELKQKFILEEHELNYSFFVPYYNFGSLGPIIRWINTESQNEKSKNIIEYDNIILNRQNFEAKKEGEIIKLSKKEFYLLEYLMINHDMVIKREALISKIWNDEAQITFNTLDSHINRLRKKVEGGQSYRIIHTIRGIGYKFGKEE